jgi:hypothetical protein
MSTNRTMRLDARIPPETAAQIESLSRLWGGVRTLSRADVVVEAVRRAWEAETKAKERKGH